MGTTFTSTNTGFFYKMQTSNAPQNELDELELEQKVKTINDHSIVLKTPQSMTHLNATSKSILNELRERHKLIEARGGSRAVYPGELLTLDKVVEVLQKFPNLSIQAKSTDAIDQAIHQLADHDGRGANRLVFFYPFLVNNNNKVTAKIALIAPQTAPEVDIKRYIDSCFEHSQPMIDLILKNRARKVKEIKEDEPGQFLLYKNKLGDKWLYPYLCSIESEITMLLKKAFKPYNYISVRDFIDDFVIYGKEKGLLRKVLDNYHIIVDEIELNPDGSFLHQPETVIHYRAQADGLEKFVFQHVRDLLDKEGDHDGLRVKLSNFKRDHIDNAAQGRKQNREKIKELISIIKSINFSNYKSDKAKKIEKTCNYSTGILEELIQEMDELIGRKFGAIHENVKKNLSNYVIEFTKRELTLCPIEVYKEVIRGGLKDEKDIETCMSEVKSFLLSEFGSREVTKEDGTKILYAVDQSYMASVMHKLTSLATEDDDYATQLTIAKQIYDELFAKKDPKLNSKIKEDHLAHLSEDMRKLEETVNEKRRREDFQKKYNVTAGGISFFVFLLICFILAFANGNLIFVLAGIPLSAIVGFIAAKFFRKRRFDRSAIRKEREKESVSGVAIHSDASSPERQMKEEKSLEIAKVAEQFVFPKKYNTVEDKILDPPTLRSRINESLQDIQSRVKMLAKEEDMNKVASAIEYSLMSHSVVIAIPNDLVPKGMPNSLILGRTDFKTPLFRNQLSEHFRGELQKHKLDKDMVKYYTFLINTLEMEYYKFINKQVK
jgi:hypothetical protein